MQLYIIELWNYTHLLPTGFGNNFVGIVTDSTNKISGLFVHHAEGTHVARIRPPMSPVTRVLCSIPAYHRHARGSHRRSCLQLPYVVTTGRGAWHSDESFGLPTKRTLEAIWQVRSLYIVSVPSAV